MSYSDWKAKSELFGKFRDRSEREGIALDACCKAAYKAGERAGRRDAEDMARRAIALAAAMAEPVRVKVG